MLNCKVEKLDDGESFQNLCLLPSTSTMNVADDKFSIQTQVQIVKGRRGHQTMHRASLMRYNPRNKKRELEASILLRKQDNEALKEMARFWAYCCQNEIEFKWPRDEWTPALQSTFNTFEEQYPNATSDASISIEKLWLTSPHVMRNFFDYTMESCLICPDGLSDTWWKKVVPE